MTERRILIVDDQPAILEQIVNHLEATGEPFELLQACNAAAALQVAALALPDLIITDWEMPGGSGIEFIRSLKADPRLAPIPVIMATGVMTTSDHLRTALEAGCVDFIRKPLDPIELQSRVQSVLLLAQYMREIQRQRDELSGKHAQLLEAMENLKQLQGLIPICSGCKKIRDDGGYWNEVEVYIRDHSEAEFSHGLCPDCVTQYFGDLQGRP